MDRLIERRQRRFRRFRRRRFETPLEQRLFEVFHRNGVLLCKELHLKAFLFMGLFMEMMAHICPVPNSKIEKIEKNIVGVFSGRR